MRSRTAGVLRGCQFQAEWLDRQAVGEFGEQFSHRGMLSLVVVSALIAVTPESSNKTTDETQPPERFFECSRGALEKARSLADVLVHSHAPGAILSCFIAM